MFLQKMHSKTNFISIAIPLSTNIRQILQIFFEMKINCIEKPITYWSAFDYDKSYQNGTKRCNLCLKEKHHILTSLVNLISKRSELVSKCRHENKFYLVNYKPIQADNQENLNENQELWQHVKLYQRYVYLKYAKVFALLENHRSWCETLSSILGKFR